ncbi:tyrosine-type recombinase/integrase [Psychromonas sp. KJ10-2]|uniref:tyrosine-type recombinase/integrase n=1 Tax=Psychromonas sp. KJ10-2 TaxID=3391822 RepID=UPI0039B577C8
MAKIQVRKGKNGVTYKVEFMRDGFRASKTFKLKKEAQQFSASITLNHDLALSLTNSPQNKITLKTAIDDYLSQYTGKDKAILGRLKWWCKCIGDLEISKIDRRTVKASLQMLLDAGKSSATHNRYKSAISSVFEFMRDEYDTNHNPAREVKQLTEKANKERYCSKVELARLFERAKESDWNRMYTIILMAITTGARRGSC